MNIESIYGCGSPKRLAAGSPSLMQRTRNQIEPIIGTKEMKIHPPPLPISCMRRTLNAKPGTNIAKAITQKMIETTSVAAVLLANTETRI